MQSDESRLDLVFESIRQVMEANSDQMFTGLLKSTSKRIYVWHARSQVQPGTKVTYQTGRFRFFQKLELEGLQYPVIYMQDSNLFDVIGIQMGMIVEVPIPRGLVILPKDIVPLELEREEKRSYMNPLYALVRKEKEHEGDSTFMKLLKELSAGYEMIERLSTSTLSKVLFGGVLSDMGSEAKLMVVYPQYLILYPMGDRTIVVISTSVKKREVVAGKMIGPDGWETGIRVTVPSDKFLNTIIGILKQSSSIVEKHQCDYPVYSKQPNLIPLLKYLVRVASNVDIIYDLNDCRELTDENLEISSRELPLLTSAKTVGVWEILGLPTLRGELNSRYATLTIECPKCKATYNYSHTKIPDSGMIQCNNCLHEFPGVELGRNY
ncbi:MAG: MJ0042-type zinc finger domain-containing protein [Candidatus Thorarchaeota archaeon]